jgi:PIN domain nuclease of toxin-antitoxin system
VARPERLVLDASALLAALLEEPGGDVVATDIAGASISTVNWCEVAEKLRSMGADPRRARIALSAEKLDFRPFTPEDADLAATLRERTQALGLSLADRACLSLAARLDAPALTADRAWKNLDVDIEVRVIR